MTESTFMNTKRQSWLVSHFKRFKSVQDCTEIFNLFFGDKKSFRTIEKHCKKLGLIVDDWQAEPQNEPAEPPKKVEIRLTPTEKKVKAVLESNRTGLNIGQIAVMSEVHADYVPAILDKLRAVRFGMLYYPQPKVKS
ncbi:hypothetical protein ACFBZI_07500 [Moraxella sp. ZJ142]|uniref:hypothetical protein n=1 Tax=Moraxella marmotae TaxID=3344520 RepID=UPI0035D4E83E